MRGLRLLFCSVLLIAGVLVLNAGVLSYDYPHSSIRFNLGVWDVPDGELGITVHHSDVGDDERLTDVHISGLSGVFSISHMLGQRFAWEFSMGGFSDSESETLARKIEGRRRDEHYETIYSSTHSVFVSYITVGLIYYPLYELGRVESNVLGDLSSFFRPYLAAGMGPHFGWDVRWNEDTITDTNFTTAMGVYPGVGLDLLLSRHFIFNIDLRYHFIEFSEPLKDITDYSGPNVVAGFKIAF
jgi:hypothetical protein